MTLWKSAILVAFIFLPASFLVAQGRALDEKVILLTSSDAPASLSKHQVISCFAQLAREWQVQERNLPKVVVFQVSKRAAETVHINDKLAVRKNSRVGEEPEYFELWLVGTPDARPLVVALENVLESHFQLQITDQQRNTVMARVIRVQSATVNVAEGK